MLVLYSTRRDSQIAIVVDRELPRILEAGLSETLDYYAEYLDLARFRDAAYQPAFRDFLRLKYPGRFDVVIPIGGESLEFVETYREALFPGTPLICFATEPSVPRPATPAALAHGGA